jgi:hypothetical protein
VSNLEHRGGFLNDNLAGMLLLFGKAWIPRESGSGFAILVWIALDVRRVRDAARSGQRHPAAAANAGQRLRLAGDTLRNEKMLRLRNARGLVVATHKEA